METPVAKRRKVLRRLLWLLVALIVVLILLPVWFPWVLRPVLNHYGFGFGDHERAGLSRFTLRNVTARWGKTQLKVDQFNCVLPSTWVWKKASDRTNAAPFFILSGGELLIIPSEKSDKERPGSLDR